MNNPESENQSGGDAPEGNNLLSPKKRPKLHKGALSMGDVKNKLDEACRRRKVMGKKPSERTAGWKKDAEEMAKGLGIRVNSFGLGLGEYGDDEW